MVSLKWILILCWWLMCIFFFRNIQGNKLIIWLGGGFQNQPYQVQVGRIESLAQTMSGKESIKIYPYKRSTAHAYQYENTPFQIYRKISPPKTENFQIKNSEIFQISAQNLDCGYSLESPRQGGSDENQQYMFLSRNKKNNVYPSKPQFYYIKLGFTGVKII